MSGQGTGTRTSALFHLRDYRTSDFDRLCQIDQQCFPPAIACAARELGETVSEPGAFTLVAESEDGETAGFVIASKPVQESGHIITLDVLPQFRRRGIGTQLMKATEERLRSLDATRIVLETPMASGPAQSLYRKLGFSRVGFVKGYYQDGTDAWLMEKRFDSQ